MAGANECNSRKTVQQQHRDSMLAGRPSARHTGSQNESKRPVEKRGWPKFEHQPPSTKESEHTVYKKAWEVPGTTQTMTALKTPPPPETRYKRYRTLKGWTAWFNCKYVLSAWEDADPVILQIEEVSSNVNPNKSGVPDRPKYTSIWTPD